MARMASIVHDPENNTHSGKEATYEKEVSLPIRLTAKRPRRLRGRAASQIEREPALAKLRVAEGKTRTLSWTSQCFCGSVDAKRYRGAWWCPVCGREKIGIGN